VRQVNEAHVGRDLAGSWLNRFNPISPDNQQLVPADFASLDVDEPARADHSDLLFNGRRGGKSRQQRRRENGMNPRHE
jgi:hypothetical protein